MKGFLDYIPGDSLFHRLDPRTKLLTAFLLCAACFAADSLAILPCLLALETALGFAAHIGRFTVRLLLKLCRLSLFLVVIQLLVIRSGEPVFPGIPLITDTGLITAAFAALRLIGATLPLAIMLSVTRCSDLAGAGQPVARAVSLCFRSHLRHTVHPYVFLSNGGYHRGADRPRRCF